jgi:hypothetical protein
MRSCASGVARPWNNEQNAQKPCKKDKGGCDGFQTCNAGRAEAHPSYGGCQAWIVGVAIISFF